MSLSPVGAVELVKLLLERGCFADESSPEPRLIATTFGTYLTLNRFDEHLLAELDCLGQLSIGEAAVLLGVGEEVIKASIKRIVANPKAPILQVDQNLLTDKYLRVSVQRLVHRLDVDHGGRRLLSSLAEELKLPSSTDAIRQRLPRTVRERTQHNGSLVVVTDAYTRRLQSRVQGAFLALHRPTVIEQWASDHEVEPRWVRDIVAGLELPGELHGDTYIPSSFQSALEHSVKDLFAAGGFCTDDQCHALGVLPSQMRGILVEAYPSALVLKHSVVHPDMLVSMLQEALTEAKESWLNLGTLLPDALLAHEDDVRTLLIDHVLADDETAGALQVGPGGALFMSKTMIDTVAMEQITELVQPFAKKVAEEMDRAPVMTADPLLTAKEKRKAKKSSKASTTPSPRHCDEQTVVPIDQIVQAATALRPDLAVIDQDLLARLCQQAFVTDDFVAACERAVQAEVERLAADRAARARTSRKDSATRMQDITVSFEDASCFATACYMVQGMAAFVEYVEAPDESMDEDRKEALARVKQDFLQGYCAEFTRRITEYCLFKNEVDEDIFWFSLDGNLSNYCSPVDLANRETPAIRLSCVHDENGKARDPLPTLRELLPTTVGTALARQWILLGSECYCGGSKPGDLDAFLSHVEENTLTICGLPFKKLDKKAKKQFLNSRRQLLLQLLADQKDPGVVLDLTVMLLFQLVKNHVVFGSHLRGFILQALLKERKISDEDRELLQELALVLDEGVDVDPGLVRNLKAKHVAK